MDNIPSGGHEIAPENEEAVRVPLTYAGAENVPILFANQFILQRERDGLILGVAQIAPPILLGSQEEREARLRQLGALPVTILGRYSISRERAAELRDLLAAQVEKFDESRDMGAAGGS